MCNSVASLFPNLQFAYLPTNVNIKFLTNTQFAAGPSGATRLVPFNIAWAPLKIKLRYTFKINNGTLCVTKDAYLRLKLLSIINDRRFGFGSVSSNLDLEPSYIDWKLRDFSQSFRNQFEVHQTLS